MRAWLAALIIAAGFVVGSAPAVAEAKDATFVGHVEGSEAYIAVSKDGKKIGGYLCDDGTISRWIAYRWLEKGSAPLVAGTTGEVLGSVRIKGNAAIGTVFVGGQSLPFRAKKVRGREVGLFFAITKQEDRLLVGGWIVDADGTQRGAVSRLNMRTLTPLPVSAAPKIDPKAPSADNRRRHGSAARADRAAAAGGDQHHRDPDRAPGTGRLVVGAVLAERSRRDSGVLRPTARLMTTSSRSP